MMNFICLVILPMVFAAAIIAIFMYCSHYLLFFARESIAQAMTARKTQDDLPSEDE